MRGNGYEGVLDLLWWAGPCSVYLQFNFLLMGGAMSPPCSLPWGDLLQKDLCQQSGDPRTVVFSAHDLTAGHCQLTALPENPGHSQASVAQSLEGSLLLFPGSWCPQAFVCALQESVFPVLWKFCNQIPLALKVKFPGASQSFCQIPRLGNLLWILELSQHCENFFSIIILQFVGRLLSGSMVRLMATSSKTYVTHHAFQVCWSQSPCPCSRPLLTCASTGDTLTLKGSVSVGSLGPGVHKVLFEPSEHLCGVWFYTWLCPPSYHLVGLLLCPWM